MIEPGQHLIPADAIFHNDSCKIRDHYEKCDSMECKQAGLYLAVYGSHSGSVKELILLGGSVDHMYDDGKSLSHVAACNKGHKILKILSDYGADINAIDVYGDTPLHNACRGHIRANIKLLVRLGSINISNNEGNYPLDCALLSDMYIGKIPQITSFMRKHNFTCNQLCHGANCCINIKSKQICNFCKLQLCEECQSHRDCGFSYCASCNRSHCVKYSLTISTCRDEHFSGNKEITCGDCGY